MKYHFGVPGSIIWISHIIIGLLLSYVGYNIVFNKKINNNIGLIVLVIGVLAAIYHIHIWYDKSSNPDEHIH
jgi:uncharacterized membrane protein